MFTFSEHYVAFLACQIFDFTHPVSGYPGPVPGSGAIFGPLIGWPAFGLRRRPRPRGGVEGGTMAGGSLKGRRSENPLFRPDHLAGLRNGNRYPAWVPSGAGGRGAFAGPGPGAGWSGRGRKPLTLNRRLQYGIRSDPWRGGWERWEGDFDINPDIRCISKC